jgi:hypothetical protein
MSSNNERVGGFVLNASGLADHFKTGNPIEQVQVDTALAWLEQVAHPLKSTWYWGTSYGLKHTAENWGRDNGLSPYVSNGAFIKAAILAGYEIKSIGGNAKIKLGLPRKTRRR